MTAFRIGVMQLTMEPLEEMLASARVMDEAGMDTIWLAEAYPWWRKHGMEARSSTVVSALMARETERLTIGWGIISPFTRHPVQVAMDARVVQEAAGPGRFLLGFGTSKIFLNNIRRPDVRRPWGRCATQSRSCAGCSAARPSSTRERHGAHRSLRFSADAQAPREVPPVYFAATAPKMQALAGEIADGCLTPSITTPAFVRYTCENVAADIDIGCTVVASIHPTDRDAGRDGAREIAGMYLANKVQNIRGAADTLLELAEIDPEEIRPVAEAMERGGRLAAKAEVTDSLLDRCKPIAGTPDDCIAAIEEYREAGCTHVMLELWGDEPARRRSASSASRCCRTSVDGDRARMSEYDADAFDAFEAAGWERRRRSGYDESSGRVTAQSRRRASRRGRASGPAHGSSTSRPGPATWLGARPQNAGRRWSASTSPRRCSRSREAATAGRSGSSHGDIDGSCPLPIRRSTRTPLQLSRSSMSGGRSGSPRRRLRVLGTAAERR